MQGSVDWQVREVFKSVENIGTSKHAAKEVARAAGAKTWADMGQKIGVHGYKTYDLYRSTAKACFEFVRAEYGLRDLTRIEPQHIQAFLVDKINSGISRATYDQYAAALNKLQLALNTYSESKSLEKTYNFDLKQVSQLASHALGARNDVSRAYRDSMKVVVNVAGKYGLTAHIQREGGTRIDEISRLRADQLRGLRPDPHSEKMKGWIEVKGKGGKIREIGVSPETYARLEKAIAEGGGRFRTNEGNYREALKTAARATDQKYEGSHGLRWNWAQERHQELQQLGLTYEQSLTIVSKEMGHERSDITCHYLH